MAVKYFYVDIDLNLNQLKNAKAENVASPVSSPSAVGRFLYNTTTGRLNYDTGSVIQEVANLQDVAGLLDFKGGYNAATDTPAISGGVGVLKGDYYVVTVAGTFLGTALEVGDSLFANQDAPTLISQWTIVQGNTVYATETVAGIIKIATQVLADAGTDDTTAMTPLKTKQASWLPNKYVSGSTSIGGGVAVTFTHSLNSTDVIPIARKVTTNEIVEVLFSNFQLNSVDVTANGSSFNIYLTVEG